MRAPLPKQNRQAPSVVLVVLVSTTNFDSFTLNGLGMETCGVTALDAAASPLS